MVWVYLVWVFLWFSSSGFKAKREQNNKTEVVFGWFCGDMF